MHLLARDIIGILLNGYCHSGSIRSISATIIKLYIGCRLRRFYVQKSGSIYRNKYGKTLSGRGFSFILPHNMTQVTILLEDWLLILCSFGPTGRWACENTSDRSQRERVYTCLFMICSIKCSSNYSQYSFMKLTVTHITILLPALSFI